MPDGSWPISRATNDAYFWQQDRIKELADERDHDIGSIHKFVAKTIDESDRPTQALQFIPVLRNHRADGQPLAPHWTGDSVVATSERESRDRELRDDLPLRPILQSFGIGRHHLRLWDLAARASVTANVGPYGPPSGGQPPQSGLQPIRSGGKLQSNDGAHENPYHANRSAPATSAKSACHPKLDPA